MITFSRKLFIAFILLTTIGSLTAHKTAKNTRQIKQKTWNDMAAQVDTWVDGLGMGIDPEIKNTVIVLNLLGFKTDASCQGHIDRGVPAPWVDFTVKDPELDALHKQWVAIIQEIDRKESQLKEKYPDLSLREIDTSSLEPLWQQRWTMRDQLEKLSRTKIMGLRDLICAFYKKHTKHRNYAYDNILFLMEFGSLNFRLISLGADWQVTRDEKERQQKLKEYQEEMRLFTNFLKDYYFSDNNFSMNYV
jgi:hypothetical protein